MVDGKAIFYVFKNTNIIYCNTLHPPFPIKAQAQWYRMGPFLMSCNEPFTVQQNYIESTVSFRDCFKNPPKMDSVGIFVFSLKYIKDIYPMTILIYLVWIHCLLKMHSVQDEHPTVTSGQIRNSGINCVCVCVSPCSCHEGIQREQKYSSTHS